MELRQLKHFVAVAQSRKFSEASARVFLSQPALSRSIQQLERDVGTALLHRSPAGVALTAAGARFLEFARMILAECDRASDAVRAVGTGAVGEVTVGMGSLYSDHILEQVILRCRREVPGVHLRTISASPHELDLLVRRSVVDFAFSSFAQVQSSPGLVYEPQLALTDILVAGAKHPLVQRRILAASDLAGARWAVINRPQSLDVHARYFVARGLPVPRAIRTNSVPLILGLVQNRHFLSFLPRQVVAPDLRRGTLRALRVEAPEGTRDAGLIYLELHEPSKAASHVMTIVRKVCAESTRYHTKARVTRSPLLGPRSSDA